ncbi:hypothetical protein SADUNF_Sadunf15G0122400 [Salix dunnii]|uniref:Uncharacterized protein n=1 Tax=Salix dunnii TaxID=1413687 RepID=A0A835MSW3_9ROSI|nr:hypothetical protein SADUNF_Sadunf15G0122400 [Salix dunnii]
MSFLCGLPLLEGVYCLACARWAWKRCLHTAGHDSETWGLATAEEFDPGPRLCCYILAVYEDDPQHPLWVCNKPRLLILRTTFEDTHGRAPPYILYLDHDHADIVVAIKGLKFSKESDYAVLLDNKLGKRKLMEGMFRMGFEGLVEKYPDYTLTFTGHSLGSDVAAMLTLLVVLYRDKLGNIDRRRIRCYTVAPARYSVDIPVTFVWRVLFDFLTIQHYTWLHIGKIPPPPPVVRTAVPVGGRFEHIVSCNVTSDHSIIWIERETQRAVDIIVKKDDIMEISAKQRIERQKTLAREHNKEYRVELQRVVTLPVPHAFSPSKYGTFNEVEDSHRWSGESSFGSSKTRENCDD